MQVVEHIHDPSLPQHGLRACRAWRPFVVLLLLIAHALGGWATIARSQEVEVLLPAKEAQVKCAFLYSFGLLTSWPESAFASADSPFVIGVLGERPHLELLDRLAKTRKVRGRPIVIQRYARAEQAVNCHLLLITAGVSPALEQAALDQLAQRPVLVVGERPLEGGHRAAPIHFVIENQVVRFRIDVEAAKARQLQIDPRLLKLAASSPTSP